MITVTGKRIAFSDIKLGMTVSQVEMWGGSIDTVRSFEVTSIDAHSGRIRGEHYLRETGTPPQFEDFCSASGSNSDGYTYYMADARVRSKMEELGVRVGSVSSSKTNIPLLTVKKRS